MHEDDVGRLGTLSAQEKRALLVRLQSAPVRKPQTAPVSLAQERIWALCQMEPESVAFNITTAYRLEGPLAVSVLEQAIQQMIRRQAVLRTAFVHVDGLPVQLIAPEASLRVALHDLATTGPEAQEALVRQLIIDQAHQPFDLAQAPLLRVSLLRLAPAVHVLVFTTHRLVFDGQCWPVLITELSALCQSASGTAIALPEMPLQYADFVAWQRAWLTGATLETQLAYWRAQLGGTVRLLALPLDHPRGAAQSRSELLTFTLPEALSGALRDLSHQAGISMFVTLLTAFQVVLYRYTAQDDFLVFTSVAGRNRPELAGLLGLFANILALRANLEGNPTVRELLCRVRDTAADAYAHQDVPFEQILEGVRLERERYASIFQVMVVFWPAPLPPLEWPGMTLAPLDIDTKPAEFDLLLHLTQTPATLKGALRYKADLFEAATVARLLERFQQVLAQIAADPDQRVAELLRTKSSAEQSLVTGALPILPSQWAYLRTPERWVNMVEAIELHQRVDPALLEQAIRRILEQHDALRTRFTYDGQWRQELPEPDGTAPFTFVDLSERPAAEREHAVKETLAALQSSLGPLNDALFHVTLFDLGADRPGYLVFSVHHAIFDNASLPGLLEDLHAAYTQLERGEPVRLPAKTTSVKQWAERLENYLRSDAFQGQLRGELALFQGAVAPLPVDHAEGRQHNTIASTAHVQVALGAQETSLLLKEFPKVHKVWLRDILLAALVQTLAGWSGESRVTLQIVDVGRNMELPGMEDIDLSRTAGCLFVTGIMQLERPATADPIEALRLVRQQLQRFPTYGISVGMAQQVDCYAEARQIPPAEVRLNYLGQASMPQLAGWNALTTTATEDFVANRRHGAIDRNPVLLNCTALLQDGQLVANWEYSTHLHQRGTVERVANDFVAALQAMAQQEQLRREQTGATGVERESVYVAPRTPTEELLAGIWAQALGYERVGINDNFFELGGDSITGLRIIAKANQAGLQLSPKTLSERQTIAELAAVATPVVARDASEAAPLTPVSGPAPLLPCQGWLLDVMYDRWAKRHHWNLGVLVSLPADVNPELLEQSIQYLFWYHDGLRVRFDRDEDGTWHQTIEEPGRIIPLLRADFSSLPADTRTAALEAYARDIQGSLSLPDQVLTRFVLFTLGADQPRRLLVTAYHLIIDLVSLQIIMEDLATVYQQLSLGQPMRLPPKSTSLKAWGEYLVQRGQSEALQRELEQHRRTVIRDELVMVPMDNPAARDRNTWGSIETVVVGLGVQETAALLHALSHHYSTTVVMGLLLALLQSLTGYFGRRLVWISQLDTGRQVLSDSDDIDLTRTVGWLSVAVEMILERIEANTPAAAFQNLEAQIQRLPGRGVGRSLFSMSGKKEVMGELDACLKDEVLLNYLGRVESMTNTTGMLQLAPESIEPVFAPENLRSSVLDCVAILREDQLVVTWMYSPHLFHRTTIERLAEQFMTNLRWLIAPDANGGV